jgi:hypothetical protein
MITAFYLSPLPGHQPHELRMSVPTVPAVE